MCEQEKAPQAFRVWLRKKRQQQLMEQRVQQLRQLELLAAAYASAAANGVPVDLPLSTAHPAYAARPVAEATA